MSNQRHVILVVDDEKEVTVSLESFFKALGHEMLTALDGEQANKVLDEARPDLVILDIRMPKVDGKQILKKIRNRYQDIKVIVITSYIQEIEEVEKIGIDGFFMKPVNLSELISRIKYVLETKDDTRAYPTKEKEKRLKKIPKARILFIEPNTHIYGYTCGLFASGDFNPGEFETKVAYTIDEALGLFGPNSAYDFEPDIVIMYDTTSSLQDMDKLADYITSITPKPKEVIIHGILPKPDIDVMQLERKGIKYCNQNVMTDEDFRKVNKKLIDFVAKECIDLGLIKK